MYTLYGIHHTERMRSVKVKKFIYINGVYLKDMRLRSLYSHSSVYTNNLSKLDKHKKLSQMSYRDIDFSSTSRKLPSIKLVSNIAESPFHANWRCMI